jgi:hypothetical protein
MIPRALFLMKNISRNQNKSDLFYKDLLKSIKEKSVLKNLIIGKPRICIVNFFLHFLCIFPHHFPLHFQPRFWLKLLLLHSCKLQTCIALRKTLVVVNSMLNCATLFLYHIFSALNQQLTLLLILCKFQLHLEVVT